MATAPPYTKNSAAQLAQVVLDAMNGSQQQAFIQEIKELGNDVQTSIKLSEAIHAMLIEEDAQVNKPKQLKLQAPDWFQTQEEYKSEVREIKKAVLTARAQAIYPFVQNWAGFPAEASDEDVIAEFEGFSECIGAVKGPRVNFENTFYSLKLLREDCESKLETDKSYDPEIKKLNEEIETLEKQEKDSVDKINAMVPGVFAKYGLNGRSHKLTLLLACGPLALVRSLKGILSDKENKDKDKTKDDEKDKNKVADKKGDKTDAKKNVGSFSDVNFSDLEKPMEEITGIHDLWNAADTAEECQRKLKDKRKQLETLLYNQEQSKNNQGRWNILLSRASAFATLIVNIMPKLDNVSKISDAVKGDVDSYVAFLQGSTKNADSERKKADAELALARGLYKLLDNALEDFITAQ